MTETRFYCDIHECGQEASEVKQPMQIIFTTEQTEGRRSTPYFETVNSMDLCKHHHDYALKGHYIFGTGAQGFNQYTFKK